MITHASFEENTQGRDFVVGDIHGCYSLLMENLNKIGFDFSKDRLFSVGDLIDRGSENIECIHLLKQPWFFAVRGNHDQFMIDSFTSFHDERVWLMNGGIWAYQEILPEDQNDYGNFMNNHLYYTMDIMFQGKKIGIVHAEPLDTWKKTVENSINNLDLITWSRTRINYGYDTPVPDIDLVVVGHTVRHDVQLLGNILYIDTGAVFSGQMTILSLRQCLEYGGLI